MLVVFECYMEGALILDQLVVALLDDGIDTDESVNGLIYNVEIDDDGYAREPAPGRASGSGNSCARIIGSLAPGVKIVSVKIFDSQMECSVALLANGLLWAIEQGFAIIVVNTGSFDIGNSAELAHLVTRAYHRGITVVASGHDAGVRTYPASYEQVIGARMHRGRRYKRGFVFHHDPMDGIDIEVTGVCIAPFIPCDTIGSAAPEGDQAKSALAHNRSYSGEKTGKYDAGTFTHYTDANATAYVAGFLAREFCDSDINPWSCKKKLLENSIARRIHHNHIFPIDWFKGKYLLAGAQGPDIPWQILEHISFVRIPDAGGVKEKISFIKEFAPALDGVIICGKGFRTRIVRSIFKDPVPVCKNVVSLFPLWRVGMKSLFYNVWRPEPRPLFEFPNSRTEEEIVARLPAFIWVSSGDIRNRVAMARALGGRFVDDGYAPMLASANVYAPLYGFHAVRSLGLLARLTEANKADVIVFEGEGFADRVTDRVSDLHVVDQGSDLWRIRLDDEPEKAIGPFPIASYKETGELYKAILSFLVMKSDQRPTSD
jgi:hypothetical protein